MADVIGTIQPAATAAPVVQAHGTKLKEFESLLKRVGHLASVGLSDVAKYSLPLASLVGIADPAIAPEAAAYAASVKLIEATVESVQKNYASGGSETNAQKLADALTIVEQPVITLFAQAGFSVNTAYVTNLVNGVVALLNAQPASLLPAA